MVGCGVRGVARVRAAHGPADAWARGAVTRRRLAVVFEVELSGANPAVPTRWAEPADLPKGVDLLGCAAMLADGRVHVVDGESGIPVWAQARPVRAGWLNEVQE